jgi:glycosyltransferase involved in cell wall biosynthesis
MALGRAVLVSDIPGNASLVEDERVGLRFRTDRELEAAALRLARDGALRARLGARARARVAQDFPPSREIDGYLAIYRHIVPAAVTA